MFFLQTHGEKFYFSFAKLVSGFTYHITFTRDSIIKYFQFVEPIFYCRKESDFSFYMSRFSFFLSFRKGKRVQLIFMVLSFRIHSGISFCIILFKTENVTPLHESWPQCRMFCYAKKIIKKNCVKTLLLWRKFC